MEVFIYIAIGLLIWIGCNLERIANNTNSTNRYLDEEKRNREAAQQKD
jgi:hypothetical protein